MTIFSSSVVPKVVSKSTYMMYAFLHRPFYTQRKKLGNKKYNQLHFAQAE